MNIITKNGIKTGMKHINQRRASEKRVNRKVQITDKYIEQEWP